MLKRFVLILMAVAMVLSVFVTGTVVSNASGEMAYNLYGGPVLAGTSGVFDTFTIDFRSGITPNYTYWALCNYGLYLGDRATTKVYKNISGGGGYAGLQNRSFYQTRAAIMSIWKMTYNDDGVMKDMYVKRMYPDGESFFDNEGDGANCIETYDWQDNNWYRMVLHSWDDSETGTTFAGEWLEDLQTGEWTLFCYYDTHLYKSAFTGGMSYFVENYWTTTYDKEREINVKNAYAYDHKKKDWFSFNTYELSYGDGGKANKVGAHTFGATEEYFWGKSGGPVEDQAKYEKESVKKEVFSITQPDKPTFSEPAIGKLAIDGTVLSWEAATTSSPQISYAVEIVDLDGKKLFSKSQTRPEITSCDFGELGTDAYKATVTVTDIFGAKTSSVITTEAYDNNGGDPTPVVTVIAAPTESYCELVDGFSNPQYLTNPAYVLAVVENLMIPVEIDPTKE